MQPALKLMIGDPEFRAIGHVVAQWAYLETQLDGVLRILLAQPATNILGLRIDQSFQKRMATLMRASKIVLATHPKELKPLLKIIEDAGSLRGKRDEIVHGHWKLYREKGRGPLTTGISVISAKGPRIKVREMPMSAQSAERIAVKISQVHVQLTAWTMRNIP